MNPRRIKVGHASGRKFILGLGLGFVLLAVGLFLGIKGFLRRAESHRLPEIPLHWEQRDQWPSEAVLPFELEYDSMVQAETGKKYRNAPFALSPDPAEEKRIEEALLACAQKANDGRGFTTDATRLFLEAKAAEFPRQFYPAYLLATWHGLRGDTARQEEWMAKTAAVAPCFLLEDGHSPAKPLPSLAIGFDRLRVAPKAHPSLLERLAHHTKEQSLDRNLVLVYPAPFADTKGRVWLPVFRDMYRWVNPAGDAHAAEHAAWFSMDSTRVGRLTGPGAKVPRRP